MRNPTINELRNLENFELFAQVNHQQIKEFITNCLTSAGKITRVYMYYQVLMVITGLCCFIRSIVLVFRGNSAPLYYSLAALVFCFSVLIVIHEILHGIALKLAGAKQITFGGYPKKFVFYAEANQFVINRRQFAFIALTPLIAVKLATLIGIILYFNNPLFYFLVLVMSVHTLFCAGDIGLLSVFYKFKNTEVYTFDAKEEKTSYFYRRI